MKKYLSYSEIALFLKDKEEYKRRYIDGIVPEETKEQWLGSLIHEAVEKNSSLVSICPPIEITKKIEIPIKVVNKLVRAVNKLPKPKEREKVVIAEFEGEKLLGIFDGFEDECLYEFKTTNNKWIWTQRSVDYNLQLSFYALLYRLTYHSYFKRIFLYRINTEKGNVKKFETARGPRDVDYIADITKRVIKELKKINWWEKRIDNKGRDGLGI
jgi:hypothetical protein